MAIDFKKFNEQFGGEAAVKELKEAAKNQFSELPDDDYVGRLEKLELAESKNGKPMIKGQFRIIEGAHKNQCLFVNQVITSGFPMHKGLEFLRSLQVFEENEIDFNGDFKAFNDLLLDIAEEAEKQRLTFELAKTTDQAKDGNEYTRIEVTDVFEQ